jgi:hypothetical protein
MSNVALLYHPNSEDEAFVRDLNYNYKRQTGREIPLVSLETVQGAEMAKLYGVERYPAIIAKTDYGDMIRLWQADEMPLVQEIAFYDHQEQKAF